MTPAATTNVGMRVVPNLGAAAAIEPGRDVGGYLIQCEIGRGGMGVVFRAEHVHLRRTVALKVLAPHLSQEPTFRERFIRESQTAAALRHPNIVAVHDAGETRGMLYLAMQLVEGTDLSERLEDERLEPDEAIALLAQVAAALDTAHQAGLVHRDVKPGNILIAGDHAYLTDFGLTKRATSQSGFTAAGQIVGSTDYLAPEQIDGRALDARTDVYALAAVLHHCLAGEPPFSGESDVRVLFAHLHQAPPPLSALRPDLPGALGDVLARGLAKDPLARHPSCTALVDDARAAAAGRSAPAGAPERLPRVVVAARRTGPLIRASVASDEFRLEEIPEGARVLDAVRAAPPDVLVFEAGTDGVLGPDDCRALRADERTAAMKLIPVILRTEAELGTELVGAGTHAPLPSPFSAMQLVIRLRDAVTVRG